MKFDPFDCTNFNRTDEELDNFFMFCVLVAGKRADSTAKKLNEMLTSNPGMSAMDVVRKRIKLGTLDELLKHYRFGKYDLYERCFKKASSLNLRTCSIQDLEDIPAIGPKTSRYFLLHSRPNTKVAVLDTHVLKYMREVLKIDTPKTTPTGKKYLDLEEKFLSHAKRIGASVADLDLLIWKQYTISETT